MVAMLSFAFGPLWILSSILANARFLSAIPIVADTEELPSTCKSLTISNGSLIVERQTHGNLAAPLLPEYYVFVPGTLWSMTIHTHMEKLVWKDDVWKTFNQVREESLAHMLSSPVGPLSIEAPHCPVTFGYLPKSGAKQILTWFDMGAIISQLTRFYHNIEFCIPWVARLVALNIDLHYHDKVGTLGQIAISPIASEVSSISTA